MTARHWPRRWVSTMRIAAKERIDVEEQYRIQPIEVEGAADADGVWVNSDGAWLGEIIDEHVEVYSDEGDYIPAPANWQELVVEEL